MLKVPQVVGAVEPVTDEERVGPAEPALFNLQEPCGAQQGYALADKFLAPAVFTLKLAERQLTPCELVFNQSEQVNAAIQRLGGDPAGFRVVKVKRRTRQSPANGVAMTRVSEKEAAVGLIGGGHALVGRMGYGVWL